MYSRACTWACAPVSCVALLGPCGAVLEHSGVYRCTARALCCRPFLPHFVAPERWTLLLLHATLFIPGLWILDMVPERPLLKCVMISVCQFSLSVCQPLPGTLACAVRSRLGPAGWVGPCLAGDGPRYAVTACAGLFRGMDPSLAAARSGSGSSHPPRHSSFMHPRKAMPGCHASMLQGLTLAWLLEPVAV